MKVYFVYKGRSSPSGGHKQIRLMVLLLNELGVEAKLLLDGEAEDDHFYQVEAPVARFSVQSAVRELAPEDVVVFPEVRLPEYLELTRSWNCRKAINNQNGFYAIAHCPPGGYYRNGIEFVIANAPYVVDITRTYLGMPANRIFQVPHWVVRGPFEPDLNTRTSRRYAACCLPRKLPEHIARVRELIRSKGCEIEWLAIDGVDEAEVARRMRESQILISTQDREGCPLPALEAMACGCLVAGYRGTSGFPHPYATDENGLWAPDRSISEAAAQILKAIRMARDGGDEYQRRLQAGYRTVQRFSKEAVLRALRDMVEVTEKRQYESRRVEIAPLRWSSRLAASKFLLEPRIMRLKENRIFGHILHIFHR